MKKSIATNFLEVCKEFPQRTFVRSLDISGRETTLSYGAALIEIASYCKRIQEDGIKRGDSVICYSEETLSLIPFFLACAFTGAVPVPVSQLFTQRYLLKVIGLVEAKKVFTLGEKVQELLEIGITPTCLDSVPHNGAEGVKSLRGEPLFATADAFKYLTTLATEIRDEDPYIMLMTSGTTGEPKLIARAHRTLNRYVDIWNFNRRREDSPPAQFLLAAALTHAFGNSLLAPAIALGAELHVTSSIDTNTPLDEVRRLDSTFLAMTPRVLRSLHKQAETLNNKNDPRLFGPSAKYIMLTGSAPDAELLKLLQSQGVNIVDYYGATEVSPVAMSPVGGWREGYVGKPYPDVQIKLAEDGELLVKSPGAMLGYYKEANATAEAFTADGFYRMGDMAEISSDGYLRILGRKKDLFNAPEGSNIYPAHIEAKLEKLPWVRQTILIGDRRPFITALIAVDAAALKGTALLSGDNDGFLSPAAYEQLYSLAHKTISNVNENLELIEQVKAILLFGVDFPKTVYDVVKIGKVKRDRVQTLKIYSDRIQAVYTKPQVELKGLLVPGTDRRFGKSSPPEVRKKSAA